MPRYKLDYWILQPQQGGTYQRGGRTTFGTELGEPLETHGLFESEEEALDTFRRFLTDHAGGDYQTAQDVTDSEGWNGWGRVFRASPYDDADVLYSVDVEEFDEAA